MTVPVTLGILVGHQQSLHPFFKAHSFPPEEGIMFFDAWLKYAFNLTLANFKILSVNLFHEIVPFVFFIWKSEPNLQISQLLIQFDLLDESLHNSCGHWGLVFVHWFTVDFLGIIEDVLWIFEVERSSFDGSL